MVCVSAKFIRKLPVLEVSQTGTGFKFPYDDFWPSTSELLQRKKNIAKMTFDIKSHWAIFNPK